MSLFFAAPVGQCVYSCSSSLLANRQHKSLSQMYIEYMVYIHIYIHMYKKKQYMYIYIYIMTYMNRFDAVYKRLPLSHGPFPVLT